MPGSGALRLLRHQLELVGHSAELGKRTGVHLPHRPAAVNFHRGFGNADIAGNLFAKATLARGDCHIALGASAKRRRLRIFQAASTVVRQVSIVTARSARCVWAEV
jgi:hypothetical protein